MILYWMHHGDMELLDWVVLLGLITPGIGDALMALVAAPLHDIIVAADSVTVLSAISRIGRGYLRPRSVAALALVMAGVRLWACPPGYLRGGPGVRDRGLLIRSGNGSVVERIVRTITSRDRSTKTGACRCPYGADLCTLAPSGSRPVLGRSTAASRPSLPSASADRPSLRYTSASWISFSASKPSSLAVLGPLCGEPPGRSRRPSRWDSRA